MCGVKSQRDVQDSLMQKYTCLRPVTGLPSTIHSSQNTVSYVINILYIMAAIALGD